MVSALEEASGSHDGADSVHEWGSQEDEASSLFSGGGPDDAPEDGGGFGIGIAACVAEGGATPVFDQEGAPSAGDAAHVHLVFAA